MYRRVRARVGEGAWTSEDVLAEAGDPVRLDRPRAVYVVNRPPVDEPSGCLMVLTGFYRVVVFLAALAWLAVVVGGWYLLFGGGLIIK